jgi:hypothetical protein
MRKLGLSGPCSAAAASLFAFAALGFAASHTPAAAEPGNLEGAWRGGGNVRFANGNAERAQCRANFRKRGGNAFSMTAVCATSSARVEQTAQLTRTGPNRFTGEFENAEFGITGSISVTLNGNSLNAALNGGGASANLNMNR